MGKLARGVFVDAGCEGVMGDWEGGEEGECVLGGGVGRV